MIDMFYKMLIYSQTTLVRFWLGIASISTSVFIAFVPYTNDYSIMFSIAPRNMWVFLLLVNAISLFYGVVTKKYSNFLLITEGILGVVIWSTIAVSSLIVNIHQITPVTVAICALWILIRYPTHQDYCD